MDVSKKSKRLIIWNGGSIIEVNIRSHLLKKTECLLMKKTECLPKLPFSLIAAYMTSAHIL